MKPKNILMTLLIVAISCMISCSHDADDDIPAGPETGLVTFIVQNMVDGQPLQTGSLVYTNDAGNLYSVDMLKYYLSNMTFIRNDGSEYKAIYNYELIDESIVQSKSFIIQGIPHGTYTSLRFYVGVDSAMNNSGPQLGDLDPVNGMLWDWITGYLYFKHEGHFIDSTSVQDIVRYHYGSLKGLILLEIPVNLTVSATPRTVTLEFNLNKVYRSPNLIDFNGNNFHQSTGPNDQVWLQQIKENFQGSFEVTAVN